MTRILFVCLGNICRSSAAEAVMKKIVTENKVEGSVFVDSAGTSGYHQGEKSDSRMIEHGKALGYDLTSISRQIDPDTDFEKFDHIVVMDKSNYRSLLNLTSNENTKTKIKQMCDFSNAKNVTEIPDPYYGGDQGFAHVFNLLEDACLNMYQELKL